MPQRHASARCFIAIYRLLYFMFNAELILPGSQAFFDGLGGWKMKKGTAIPPGHRRILKKGRL